MKLGRIEIDQKYLPSRKFIIGLSIMVAITLVIVAFSFKSTKNYEAINNNALSVNASSSFETFKQVDTDKDSLPDWQEALYGTDPRKADTDNDGTPDNEELRVNRDPLKANTASKWQEPNDKIDPKIIAQDQKMANEYESLNPSQKMARDVLSEFIANQPSDRQMTQDEQDILLSRILNNMPEKADVATTTIGNLNIVSTDSTSLQNYSSTYFKITEKLRPVLGKEMDAIANLAQAQDEKTETKKVLDVLVIYKEIIKSLSQMPVPSAVSDYHLKIIDDLENMVSQDNDMLKISTDPLTAYSSYMAYIQTASDLTQSLATIDTQLNIVRK
ncbi:MAG: hypothetical protein WC631_02910 [Candidatus Paceibacterota bacterium]|jgi:hypothetical protein